MRFKQIQPLKATQRNRLYSPTAMSTAYLAVRDGKSIRGASKQYAVPLQTLRDRVIGKVDPECVTTGRPPLFTLDEEATLANHLKSVSQYGYGYTRSEVTLLATDYGKQMGKVNNTLTRNWMDGFLRRWPELKLLRPRSLELARAKSASEPIVTKYFEELMQIVTKYDLNDKPQLIFNIDEKGISPNHTPPPIIGVKGQQPPAVTTGKSKNTTIIGSGSAAGMAVPPYFVFAGKRWSDELMTGKTPGASGTLSENGWSNTQIFREYLENHFLKFAPSHIEHPLLLILDGHSTHVSVGLIDWAKSQNIILFILPAHTSHILQPLDVSCYGPFQRMYNNECHKYMRTSPAAITRYNVCELACKVYTRALSADNLVAGFKKTGICPTNKDAVDALNLVPAEVFTADVDNTDGDTINTIDHSVPCHPREPANTVQNTEHVHEVLVNNEIQTNKIFFETKLQTIKAVKSVKKKSRKSVSNIVSGKPITEDKVQKRVHEYELNRKTPLKRKRMLGKQPTCTKRSSTTIPSSHMSPQPGPSNIVHNLSEFDSSSESDEEAVDKDTCCVCHKRFPDAVRDALSLIYVKWVKCDNCMHWVHLQYCTPVIVIRRAATFLCPHCSEE